MPSEYIRHRLSPRQGIRGIRLPYMLQPCVRLPYIDFFLSRDLHNLETKRDITKEHETNLTDICSTY